MENCRWGIFSIKKPHPWFYCIITSSVIPSRGFPSCCSPGHTLNYCWQKNNMSEYLHPSTISGILSPRNLCFSKSHMTAPLLIIFQAFHRINIGVASCFKITFQSKTTLHQNDKCLKFLKLYFERELWETVKTIRCITWCCHGARDPRNLQPSAIWLPRKGNPESSPVCVLCGILYANAEVCVLVHLKVRFPCTLSN